MSKLLNLEVANTNAQTIISNGKVNLGNITRKLVCNDKTTFEFTNGSDNITINQCGFYAIMVNATFNGSVAGNVILQLNVNGTNVPQAFAEETITTPSTEIRSVSFGATLRVLPCSPITLTFVNSGVGATYSNINVSLVKVV